MLAGVVVSTVYACVSDPEIRDSIMQIMEAMGDD